MFNKKNAIFTIIILFFSYSSLLFANDIKKIRWPSIQLYNFIWYQSIIILLLIFLYFYNYFFVNKKKKINTKVDVLLENKNKLILKLKNFKKNSEKLNKSEFYSELNSYFREYFSLLNISNSDILTLADIKKSNLDKNLISLFEKSYLSEFKNTKNESKNRLETVDELIKMIK